MTTTWHAEPAEASLYVEGRLDAARSASLETHLLTCARCRSAVAEATPTTDLLVSWEALVERIDDEPSSRLARVLLRVGLPDPAVRMMTATSALRVAFVMALSGTLALAMLTARLHGDDPSDRATLVFLTVMALAPLATIAAAYGPSSDPAFEVAAAAPFSGVRLLLLRSVFVLVVTTAVGVGLGSVLEGPGWRAVSWLLPALALSAAGLLLMTRLSASAALAAVGGVWAATVVSWSVRGEDLLAPYGARAQLVWLALSLTSALLFVQQVPNHDLGRVR